MAACLLEQSQTSSFLNLFCPGKSFVLDSEFLLLSSALCDVSPYRLASYFLKAADS